ncbi:MAG: hypothetical protein G01um101424_355, partial [Parcubacteria group bacterium Gr01-1014_24]
VGQEPVAETLPPAIPPTAPAVQIITVRGPAGPPGPPGPPGPAGLPGVAGTSNSYPAVIYTAPPAPAVNFSGASYFSATNITSDQLTNNLATITTLTVSGNSTITGSQTVTGALTVSGASSLTGAITKIQL